MGRPFDSIFKSLAEEDPRALLYLVGMLPLNTDAQVESLPREFNSLDLVIDHAYQVTDRRGKRVVHFEAQAYYRHNVPHRIGRYAAALAITYELPVTPVLVLLSERGAPATIPDRHTMKQGNLIMKVRYRVVKLWDLDANVVLKSGPQHLLPWVTLMRTSPDQLGQALEAIRAAGDRKLAGQAMTLAGLRYTKGSLESINLLERVQKMLTEEIIKESAFYQDTLEEGIAKGIKRGIEQGLERGKAQGLAEGRMGEARAMIRRLLARRFPGLGPAPQLDQIQEAELLEDLFDQLLATANDKSASALLARHFDRQ